MAREREQVALENSYRLMSDAILLRDHGRNPSAFALAILSLEALGKLLLWKWEAIDAIPKAPRRFTYHIRKQLATAYFIAAGPVVEKIRGNNYSESPEFLDVLVNFIASSEATKRVIHATIGAVEKTKHLALYDEVNVPNVGLTTADFGRADVNRLLSEARAVLDQLDKREMHLVGRAMYCVHLTEGDSRVSF